MEQPRILIVEDEEGISKTPVLSPRARGLRAIHRGTTFKNGVGASSPTRRILVLLDVMLPDGDGRDLCGELRAAWDHPIKDDADGARWKTSTRSSGSSWVPPTTASSIFPFSAGELVRSARLVRARPLPR